MITVAILTVSDSAHAGTRKDISGPELRRHCEKQGWRVVETATVPDEITPIAKQLTQWADSGEVSLIITSGGTGVSPRDVTPEATRQVLSREIPGLGELMRARGLEQTKFSALSRAVAGSRGRSLIVNTPGSPKGAVFSVTSVQDLVPHILRLLSGNTEHSSNEGH